MTKLLSSLLLGLLLLTLTLLPQVAAQQYTPTPLFESYTVQEGDTLGGIAFRYGTTSMAILRANNLSDLNVIIAGTTLLIPLPLPPTATPSPTLTPPPLVPVAPIGFDLAGEVASLAHLDTLRQANMTWAKLRLTWQPGDSTAAAQRIITRLHDAGFRALLEVSGAPNDANPTQFAADYVTFLGDVAALAPDALEIWSGMNTTSRWADAADYAHLLESAYTAIKRANPNVLVISGALTADDASTGYLNALAAADAGLYADCIGMSYTLGALPPSATVGDARGDAYYHYFTPTMATYFQYFPNKPLCFTEVGYYAAGETLPEAYAWAQATTPEQRAAWLASAATTAQRLGRVRLFTVYNVDAENTQPDDSLGNYAIRAADGTCSACDALSAVVSVD